MKELIKVTTDGQGSSVVSARELYAFLEVKSRFNDLIKNRIIKYGFIEGRDYVEVEGVGEDLDSRESFTKNVVKPAASLDEEVFQDSMKNPTGGRPSTDYAITPSMAKELSMVERNAKGKEARLYFIEREELARKLLEQLPTAPAVSTMTDQVLLQLMAQSNQLLANQQQQLDQLRNDMGTIMAGRRPAPRIKQTPRLPAYAPDQHPATLRQMIHRRVNEYCGFHGVTQSETYHYLYKRLQVSFGIVVYNIPRIGKESYLDALERCGHLNRLYSVVMAELSYSEE